MPAKLKEVKANPAHHIKILNLKPVKQMKSLKNPGKQIKL